MTVSSPTPQRDPLAMLRPHPRKYGDPILRSWWRLALGALVLAALAAFLLRERGGLLVLGVLLGVLAASGFALLLAMLRPIGALFATARPLGVALLLIVAAGTVDSPVGLQLVAGMVAMLVGLTLLVRPEWPQFVISLEKAIKRPETPAQRRRQRWWIGGGVAGLVVVLLLALFLPPGGSLDARGGAAAYLFALAVVLLGVSLLLRLVGYSRSIVHLPVAVLVLLTGVRLAMSAGLLPGDETFADVTPALLLGLAGVGLLIASAVETWGWVQAQRTIDTAALERSIALSQPLIPRVVTNGAAALGIIAGLVASVALLGAMVLSANPGEATGAIADSLEAAKPGPPPAGFSAMDDEALGRAYAPLLLFSKDAKWSPVSVDEYVQKAGDTLEITDWEHQPVDRSELRNLGDCPTIVPVPCFKLDTKCESVAAGCAQPLDPAPRDGERRKDGTVYVRVVHRGAPRPDRSPDAFGDEKPYGADVQTIVQYWFFYAFDDWVSPVIAGQLRQYHQADWEAVTIGFSKTKPLFVGFSQHCGGEWYPWEDVRVTGGTHTVVAVAEGSQANYRFPNPSQAPDWTGCANLPARTTTLVSYASNIRDRTRADWSWSPPDDGFTFVDARDFPMNVVARWAPYSRTELQTLHKKHKLGEDAAGPATPSVQPLWREPMRTIFAGHTWHQGKE